MNRAQLGQEENLDIQVCLVPMELRVRLEDLVLLVIKEMWYGEVFVIICWKVKNIF